MRLIQRLNISGVIIKPPPTPETLPSKYDTKIRYLIIQEGFSVITLIDYED